METIARHLSGPSPAAAELDRTGGRPIRPNLVDAEQVGDHDVQGGKDKP